MGMVSSLVRRVGGKPWFARLGRAFMPVDRMLGKATKGRFVGLGLPDVPSLLLTTTGRKSGLARSSPLLYAPDGDGFVVIGSNWGQEHHPAWSSNLLADPAATVTTAGRQIPVRGRLVTDAERVRLRDSLLAVWPEYATYERRAPNRTLRIFRLEPTSEPSRP